MNHRRKDICVAALIVLLALVATTWALANQRPTAAMTAMLSLLLCVAAVRRRRWVAPLMLLAWLAIAFSPVELSTYSAPGGPRLMPLVMGLVEEDGVPVPIGVDLKNDLVLGGDVVGGQEPRWVIVW